MTSSAQDVQDALDAAKKDAQILKTEIEVAERDLADIEAKFKKYQASVDAGYDDNETLALRDSHGYDLEEIQEGLVQLLREHAQVMLKVSELEALKDGYKKLQDGTSDMMTKKELLERASKVYANPNLVYCPAWKCMAEYDRDTGYYTWGASWNSLTNSDNALDLVTRLGISVMAHEAADSNRASDDR